MGPDTPLWISSYGHSSGTKLMGLAPEDAGVLVAVTEQEEW